MALNISRRAVYAECHLCSVSQKKTLMLGVVKVNGVILSVVMPCNPLVAHVCSLWGYKNVDAKVDQA